MALIKIVTRNNPKTINSTCGKETLKPSSHNVAIIRELLRCKSKQSGRIIDSYRQKYRRLSHLSQSAFVLTFNLKVRPHSYKTAPVRTHLSRSKRRDDRVSFKDASGGHQSVDSRRTLSFTLGTDGEARGTQSIRIGRAKRAAVAAFFTPTKTARSRSRDFSAGRATMPSGEAHRCLECVALKREFLRHLRAVNAASLQGTSIFRCGIRVL